MNKKITHWKNKKVWLVGASDGIGAALAKKFLSEGVDLYVSSKSCKPNIKNRFGP